MTIQLTAVIETVTSMSLRSPVSNVGKFRLLTFCFLSQKCMAATFTHPSNWPLILLPSSASELCVPILCGTIRSIVRTSSTSSRP